MTRKAVPVSRGKGEVEPRRLFLSFTTWDEGVEAYNRETPHNSEYPYHAPISPRPQADPKYQVRLYISSSFPCIGVLVSLPGTASVGPSSLSIHL